NFFDVTEKVHTQFKHFQAFEAVSEESPSLYLGFDSILPNERILLYFNTTEKVALDLTSDFKEQLTSFYEEQKKAVEHEQRVVWEYFAGKEWKNLFPEDTTRNFTQSGFVEFIGPTDHRSGKRFGENLFWIRCRLEMGGYDQLPRINHIALNTVPAANIHSHSEEILGSSDGTPNQTFEFHFKPVLDGQQLLVLEKDEPEAGEAAIVRTEEGEEAIKRDPDGRGWWVRWHQVESFFESSISARHYIKDTVTSAIRFGDGRKGKVPPEGDHNIKAVRYQSGGGVRGNVPVGSLDTLAQALAYIDGVTNLYPAGGGSDQESVEEAKERGPHTIKSRNRAVTAEDFVWLAKQASSSIARAHCLAAREREGEVKVIIVPKFDERATDLTRRLVPSNELLRRVKNFLDSRRLVSTVVNVVKPRYVELSLQVEVIRNLSVSGDRLKRDVEEALRRYLHPLVGGRQGLGWEFGRNIYKVDLYHVIEDVTGVEFVDRIEIFNEDRKIHVDSVRLADDELAHLIEVEVREKSRERIG
ncbi:MAG: putative baseplate assembly protein, partial [Deltaproteobacteria bacterium]|nr:putative baseplate assembly protein [Deltaproteobacteria bacterium]